MAVLFAIHEAFYGHDPGAGHVESPERLAAVMRGAAEAHLEEELVVFSPRAATTAEIRRVHSADYVAGLEAFCLEGGGRLDPDTTVVPESFEAARHAAGAGLEAVERLRADGGPRAAFLAVRPPGHHALSERAMGFCLFNNIAITAASLVEEGERVLIVDIDAHHGNGTQAAFYERSDVMFVSVHQYPFYPGTGAVGEVGEGEGAGSTLNLPFPAGTTGDAYRLALDEVIVPAVELFAPTWLLVSAGFDAHRDDPLCDLGLSAGDFGDLTERLVHLAPPGRRVFFLEGGYDLGALESSVAATVTALGGGRRGGEALTSGGEDGLSGADAAGQPAAIVAAARAIHERYVG